MPSLCSAFVSAVFVPANTPLRWLIRIDSLPSLNNSSPSPLDAALALKAKALHKLVTPTSTHQPSILRLLITEMMDLTLTLIILMVVPV
ncbi:hypothetical protein M404DRAFT_33712 [Pisolithus tinctorius Marx 270]|uniref:Uncharacterized protein n=1 Tax=Pisolithus tinctorius Marx 270 TaxID=870435 RepID=A0A0C3NKZ4_PISTI|nr:hypothetical protein M404DRAFT_33712 [Pisolithus tinctorius Marx 270]